MADHIKYWNTTDDGAGFECDCGAACFVSRPPGGWPSILHKTTPPPDWRADHPARHAKQSTSVISSEGKP